MYGFFEHSTQTLGLDTIEMVKSLLITQVTQDKHNVSQSVNLKGPIANAPTSYSS